MAPAVRRARKASRSAGWLVSCFDAAGIARVATTGDDHPHLAECLSCRRQLASDRATRTALRALPVPALGEARRKELAAELLAIAQHPVQPRRRTAAFALSAGALAAAAALWIRPPTLEEVAVSVQLSSSEPIATGTSSVMHLEAPPQLQAPQIEGSGATFRHVTGERDVIALYEGAIELDTRATRDADVTIGDAVVRVNDAAVKIRARGRTIVSVQVVVGSAQITVDGKQLTIQRDAMWLAGPSAKQQSLAAFRDGWMALRAGHHREAMEMFDRVTDPIVIEEATYWAAIAAQRSGDAELARVRLDGFLRRFPSSPYASDLPDGNAH